jgi:hypothetical protein
VVCSLQRIGPVIFDWFSGFFNSSIVNTEWLLKAGQFSCAFKHSSHKNTSQDTQRQHEGFSQWFKHFQTFVSRSAFKTSTMFRMKWLPRILATSSCSFKQKRDLHEGHSNSSIFLPALAAFLRCLATKFSKQCLQYEWKQGNVRGSCSRSRHIEQQRRFSTLSTGILSGRAAMVGRESSHFAQQGNRCSQSLHVLRKWKL